MAQKEESKQERPLQSFTFKDFQAVNTTNARIACPPQSFAHLENAQPIGASNLHSVNDISASLHDYAGDTIYTDQNANIGGTEYLIAASSNSKLFSFNVSTNIATNITGAASISTSGGRMAQYQNTQVLYVDASGYYNWNGSGNIVSIGGVTGAPTSGSAIAVYQNRVWIAQGRVIFFSAPGSFTDFTTASGGGSTTLVDPTLRSAVQALFAANGYLYVFGVSSIDAISDLYIPAGASPPTPNFTKLNLSAIIGTDQQQSIGVYGRLVLFANRYGAWSLYGTTLTQISSPDPNNTYNSAIDGTWQYVDFTQTITMSQCLSNNLLCAAFLIKRLNDPVLGSSAIIAMYQGNAAGGRWWFSNPVAFGASTGGVLWQNNSAANVQWVNSFSQTVQWMNSVSAPFGLITRVTTAYVNNAPALFAYIGNKIYQVFARGDSSPPATISTALWDFGDSITAKQVIRAGIGITVIIPGGGLQSFSLDTPVSSSPFLIPSSIGGGVQWVNNVGTVVSWVNSLLATVLWNPAQFATYWGQTPQGFAKYVGYTLKTNQGMVFELNSFSMDYKWAARWSGN